MNAEPQIARYCQPCRERRAMEAPARHTYAGIKMCQSCFDGATAKYKKEEAMPRRVELDLGKLRELHGMGLSDTAIGEKLGASAGTILMRRRELGLPSGKRGRRANAGLTTPRPQKPQRKAAKAAAKSDGAALVTVCVSERLLDAMWSAFPIEKKARLIEFFAEE